MAIEKWGEQHSDLGECNVLPSKVVDRIEVTKDRVLIVPVVGACHQGLRL